GGQSDRYGALVWKRSHGMRGPGGGRMGSRTNWLPAGPVWVPPGGLLQVPQLPPPPAECVAARRKDAAIDPVFGLVVRLHWIVNYGVMIGLLVASIWVWAIVIDKFVLFSRTRKSMDRFEQAFWSGQSLEELYRNLSSRPNTSLAALFVAAMREWKRSFEGPSHSFAGLQMRIEKVMDVTIAREVERLERRLLVLATVGSAGPFVGLFGTVWGIMTSF